MKQTTELIEKTSDLRHTIITNDIEGNYMKIKIRLNDECKNGHCDFSITGDIYQKGKPITDRYFISGGCIHEDIIAKRPDLQLFVDLHLSDSKGVPMYAIENGYYHLKNTGSQSVKEYFRLSDSELKEIEKAEDKLHFTYIIHSLNLPAKWLSQANQAIELLEKWTGKKFEDNSKKVQWVEPAKVDIETVENRIKEGYYAEDKKKDRQTVKQQEARNKILTELQEDRDKSIKKANDEYNVKLAVLNAGIDLDNFIYYNHSNEGSFNWKGYGTKVTNEQFNAFMSTVDISNLPEGIKFNIKD